MTKAEVLLFDSLPSLPPCPDNEYIKTHLESIKNEEYKLHSTLAYSLFSSMLKNLYNIRVSDITLAENPHGKPIIVGSKLYFNVSHTSGAVACIISDKEVGIDIENIAEIKKPILNKCFTEAEISGIKTPADFYRYWTLKESYLKALGCGIDRKLSDIEFLLSNNIVCADSGAVVPFKFFSTATHHHSLSICSEDTFMPSDLTVRRI